MAEDTTIDDRTREQKLKALVQKDIDPEVTRLAERALERRRQERSD